MNDSLTVDDICNSIAMERTVCKEPFVIVEGVTDSRLYGKFLDRDHARLRIAHSRNNVNGVVRKLVRRGDDAIIGIIDADLDLLEGKQSDPPIFRTDCRDMEATLFRSKCLDDVLDEYADQDRLGDFVSRNGDVREVVLEASYPIGLLMHISKEQGYGLCFRNLDFNTFIRSKDLSLDVDALVRTVLGNTKVGIADENTLKALLAEEMRNLDDRWKAARGHDIVRVLLMGLKGCFGSFNATNLDEGALSGALRLAFSDARFRDTKLYTDTSEWAEKRNVRLWDLNRT